MSGLKPSNTNTQEVEQHLSAEQHADLSRLEQMAGGEAGGEVQEVAEAVGPDLAQELGGAIDAVVKMFGPMFPSIKGIYTPEVIAGVSGSLAVVCNKHGWLQDGLMGRYGEEIACLFIVGPVAVATYKGVQADIAARTPPKQVAAPGELNLTSSTAKADQVPGAKTVMVGVPA